DALPPFVRASLRAFLCARDRGDGLTAEDEQLPVFVDIFGERYSLARLKSLASVAYTRDPPPFPRKVFGVVLSASEAEAAVIERRVSVEDVTEKLRQQKAGDARREALPLAAMELAPEVRAQCIVTFTMSENDVEGERASVVGEVGLLAPMHEDARGIVVHTGR